MGGRKRRIFFMIFAVVVIIIAFAHIISMFTLDQSIEYKKITFSSPKVPMKMNGYRIAFIIDTHAMTAQDLQEVVRKLNILQLDLLLLGGDFASAPGAPERSMEILSQVAAADGIYGVEGNHDKYLTLFAAMEQYAIQPLSNSGARIGEHFYLAGVEDLWNRNPDIAVAIEEAQSDDFVLLVAHNPDITMVQDTTSVDLILSGHTHGGQVTFFGIWAPALTLRKKTTGYGQRFMSGWGRSRDGTPVYVSNGTGYQADMPRVFARPQVILITLAAG